MQITFRSFKYFKRYISESYHRKRNLRNYLKVLSLYYCFTISVCRTLEWIQRTVKTKEEIWSLSDSELVCLPSGRPYHLRVSVWQFFLDIDYWKIVSYLPWRWSANHGVHMSMDCGRNHGVKPSVVMNSYKAYR